MPNAKSLIDAHNKKITHPTIQPNDPRTCNCIRKEECPLNENCLASSLVYEATINSNIPNYAPKKYIGLCEGTFKKRFSGHKTSFNLERYKNSTALSIEYWRIKELNGNPSVSWKIIKHAKPYSPESKRCLLCLQEKFEIANYQGTNLLNKRTEIIAKCRHQKKFLLQYSEAAGD